MGHLLANISLSGTYDFGSDGCVIEGDYRATQQRPQKEQPSKGKVDLRHGICGAC